MLTVVVILKALVEVAGLALIGQGILYLLAGAGREQNIFYRTLKLVASPAWKLARLITPRFVPDRNIGWAAFFLVFGLWLGLGIEKAQQCRLHPDNPHCAADSPPAGEPGTR
jgi:hypothetical protein